MAELTSQQQAFIERYAPYANLASQQLGIPSRVILGKLAIESNWGQAMFGNNIAGLKTGAKGQNLGSIGSGNAGTFEDLAGGRTQITDKFLKYATPEQGIGGFVNWLTNSGIGGINSLADRSGGGIYNTSAAADTAAINALNASPYSTDKNLPVTLPKSVAMIPDLAGYGIASSFDPSANKLQQLAPNAAGGFNVSQGAGSLGSNDYFSGILYQKQGQVLPREKGATGLGLPSPRMNLPADSSNPLDMLSDAISGGLTRGGKALRAAVTRLVDPNEYLAANPDVRQSGMDAITHFLKFGQNENRAIDLAGNHFDGNAYLASNADVAAAGMNPLLHFLQLGNLEGRAAPIVGADGTTPTYAAPGTVPTVNNAFNADLYLAANPDVLAAGVDPLQHYLNNGFKEGRTLDPYGDQLNANIDFNQYLKDNPDVAAAGINPLEHYLLNGAAEGRTLSAPGLTPTQGPDGLTPTQDPRLSEYRSTINDAFNTLLHRPADAAGMDYFDQQMTAGTLDPAGLQRAIKASPEYLKMESEDAPTQAPRLSEYRDTVNDIYEATLHRPADASGSDYWSQALQNGSVSPDSITRALTQSPEYASLIGPATAATQGPDGLTSTYGAGRWAPTFNPTEYLKANTDVAAAGVDPWQHYLQNGFSENRAVDTAGHHLPQNFSSTAYLAANPDVAMAGLNPLQHFLQNGASEGRQGAFSSPVGDYDFSKLNTSGYKIQGLAQPAAGADNKPLGTGITYNNGSVQYGGVDIGKSALFDPASSEKSYLNTQVDQTNAGAQQSAKIENMLTQGTGAVMPVFGVNGTGQGNGNVVAQNQLAYLNQVNNNLAGLRPQEPSGSSFLVGRPPAAGLFW